MFTKSDMIHLQNKGESLENIIAGLHEGNAANYISTIVSTRKMVEPIAFIGGMSLNELQVLSFRKYYPNLKIPPHPTSLGALGVALVAARRNIESPLDLDGLKSDSESREKSFSFAPPLKIEKTQFPEDNRITAMFDSKSVVDVFLGIDIGSTTTKYAMIDTTNRVVRKALCSHSWESRSRSPRNCADTSWSTPGLMYTSWASPPRVPEETWWETSSMRM